MSRIQTPQRLRRHGKLASPRAQAAALRKPTKAQTLPEAERDYRNIGPIPPSVLSGEEPISDHNEKQQQHPLGRLAQGEELSREFRKVTAAMDRALFPEESPAVQTSKTKHPAFALNKPPTPEQKRLLSIARLIAQTPTKASNAEYCEYLDRVGIRPPKSWSVSNYVEAWKNSKFRSRIRNEKSRARALRSV
jgi:hypothetical protein